MVLTALPLALSVPVFPMRSLAQCAARAGLGGPRETLLGVIQAARLVDGMAGRHPLPDALRRTRAGAARSWLAALAMPAAARQAIGRTIDASAGDNLAALAEAWDAVVQVAMPLLDLSARNELRRISARVHAGAPAPPPAPA